MKRTDLHSGWSLHPVAGPLPEDLPNAIPATVPGCVHTDLLSAGLIPDPYVDSNEDVVQWIGHSDFVYRTSFEHTSGGADRVELACEGLDTVATLTLNGIELGRTANMHRSYRFDVTDRLVDGENTLEVRFDSALTYATAAQARVGVRPFVGNKLPYNAIRKMASNFGWDWGPVLITAGIWKPIHLDAWSVARFDNPVATADVDAEGVGRVRVRTGIERTRGRQLILRAALQSPDGRVVTVREVPVDADMAQLDLSLANPELWWPHGYGAHPLYRLRVDLLDAGSVVDEWSHDIGFGSVAVAVEQDEFGTGFTVYVNGQRIFIKGANWIPDDCFVTRVTREDYESGVKDAVDADMNLLRIWGGGIFESDDLYAAANRAGIMVWQDFLFACAAYSEEPELWEEVEAEARENVARLAPNPSLVIYNGSNENVEGYYEWGWRDALGPDVSWGAGYYDRLLPQIVSEVDGTRPYFPSSPFSPVDPTRPQDPDNGTVHSWEVWNRQDYATYRDSIPRFVAEFGFQGPPNAATIARAIHDDPLTPSTPGMLAHQKADDGNGKLERGFRPHLPEPHTFEDWHFTTQLNQAQAIRFGISHFRSHAPRNGGSIIWQLNDCWPVTSWAAVDGDRHRKPLWYALRSLNASRWTTIQPRDGSLALIVANDSAEPWTESVTVRRVGFDGVALATQSIDIDIPPRESSVVKLHESVATATHPAGEAIVADSSARRANWFFVEDKNLSLQPFDAEMTVERPDGGYLVTITPAVFTKDIVLNADRVAPDAVADEALITLLPGERYSIFVATGTDIDPDAFRQRSVLQSVNNLLHPVTGDSIFRQLSGEEQYANAFDR